MVREKRILRKLIPLIVWSVVVIGSDVLARFGVIPTWVFYALLIALHAWIFTKIGIRIYKRHTKHKKSRERKS